MAFILFEGYVLNKLFTVNVFPEPVPPATPRIIGLILENFHQMHQVIAQMNLWFLIVLHYCKYES